MDKQLIQQFGTDILSYRLRSKRHKRRMQHKDFEKHLLKLDREWRSLRQKQRNLGWEPLVPPFQRGWKRTFVLRDDVARSKDAAFFQAILDKINTRAWSHRKNFLVRKRKWGKKIYVVKGQQLQKPYQWEFNKMNFNEKEKGYFDMEFHYRKPHEKPYLRYVFRDSWRFVLKVHPNMIEKVERKDPELDAAIQYIDSYLRRNDYEGKSYRLVRSRNGSRIWRGKGDKDAEINPLKNKPLYRIIEETREELL